MACLDKLSKKNLALLNKRIEEFGDTPEGALEFLIEQSKRNAHYDVLQAQTDFARAKDVQSYIKEYSGKMLSNPVSSKLPGIKPKYYSDFDLRQQANAFQYAPDPSGRYKGQNVDILSEAIAARYTRPLEEYLEKVGHTIFSRTRNPKMVEDFYAEMSGIKTGNKDAEGLAKVWKEISELSRLEGNELGKFTGKIEDWIPQEWNPKLMLDAGFDAFKNDMYKSLDIKRSFPDATKDEINDHLQLWYNANAGIVDKSLEAKVVGPVKTKRIDALHKAEVEAAAAEGRKAKPRSSFSDDWIQNMTLANRDVNRHRVIHFKSNVEAGKMAKKYGSNKNDLATTLMESLRHTARNNATLKLHGPDPDGAYTKKVRSGEIVEDYHIGEFLPGFSPTIRGMYLSTTGKLDMATPGANTVRALKHERNKNWILTGKLGSVIATSIPSDMFSRWTRAGLFDLYDFKPMKAVFNKASKEEARAAGHASELLSNNSGAIAKHGDTTAADSAAKRSATGILRGQGLTHTTNWSKASNTYDLSASLGRVSDKSWKQLSKDDRVMLEAGYIREQDWDVIRTKGVVEFEGVRTINAEKLPIGVQERYLSFIIKEADVSTPTPRGLTNAITKGGQKKGTKKRGLFSYFWQFKGTPLEEYVNTVGVMRSDLSVGKKVVFGGKRIVGGIGTGFVILNLQNLIAGKGLIDVTEMSPEEILALSILCLTKSGGLGLFADNLLESAFGDGYHKDIMYSFIPPALQIGSTGLAKLGGYGGGDTFGSYTNNLAQFGMDQLPGQNLWQLRLILDRGVKDTIEEVLDPRAGKRARNKIRTLRDKHKTDFWWRPGP